MSGLGQRRAQRPDNHAAHQRAVAEADFGFCRMHIDVKLGRINVNEQGQRWMAITSQKILIRTAHRTVQQFVAHRTPVDD